MTLRLVHCRQTQKLFFFVPQYVFAIFGRLLYKGTVQLSNKYNHSLTNSQLLVHMFILSGNHREQFCSYQDLAWRSTSNSERDLEATLFTILYFRGEAKGSFELQPDKLCSLRYGWDCRMVKPIQLLNTEMWIP